MPWRDADHGLAAGEQPFPQRTGDHREQDIVDGAAVRLPDLLDLLQLGVQVGRELRIALIEVLDGRADRVAGQQPPQAFAVDPIG